MKEPYDAATLIASGYYQVSRRHRTLARLPARMTGREALARHDAQLAQVLDERNAGDYYLRVHAIDTLCVDRTTFEEFRHLGGTTYGDAAKAVHLFAWQLELAWAAARKVHAPCRHCDAIEVGDGPALARHLVEVHEYEHGPAVKEVVRATAAYIAARMEL